MNQFESQASILPQTDVMHQEHNNIHASIYDRAKGKLALVGVSTVMGIAAPVSAEAQTAPVSAEATLNTLVQQVALYGRGLAPDQKFELTSAQEGLKILRHGVGEDDVKKVSVKNSGSKLRVKLTQEDTMQAVLMGGIYTEKFLPGYNGMEDTTVKSYSKVLPFLLSPDLVSKNTVKVQAVSKVGSKWKTLSGSVAMPAFDNYSVTPLATDAPEPNGSVFSQDEANGYMKSDSNASQYVKNQATVANIPLRHKLSASQRAKGFYLKINQRWNPTTDLPGSQSVGTHVSYFGPFKKSSQSKTLSVSGTYKAKNK